MKSSALSYFSKLNLLAFSCLRAFMTTITDSLRVEMSPVVNSSWSNPALGRIHGKADKFRGQTVTCSELAVILVDSLRPPHA
ncbi:hypothetical protein M408DRAFT_209569 [Serendipita vermifera MAFF 305830]|uniref:Uncharacterized protein n=1 Tax=Serendipita vermifera MAFF 305830 TaxID=933852 RepID=A0A0C3AJK5_SERVB|nr:hypothetical protein M408DRAFT_209569 [Serendipita vermifera MAFF 305830]